MTAHGPDRAELSRATLHAGGVRSPSLPGLSLAGCCEMNSSVRLIYWEPKRISDEVWIHVPFAPRNPPLARGASLEALLVTSIQAVHQKLA